MDDDGEVDGCLFCGELIGDAVEHGETGKEDERAAVCFFDVVDDAGDELVDVAGITGFGPIGFDEEADLFGVIEWASEVEGLDVEGGLRMN